MPQGIRRYAPYQACWGKNEDWQSCATLGQTCPISKTNDVKRVVDVGGTATDFFSVSQQFALGFIHTCSLEIENNEVWCWGKIWDGTKNSVGDPNQLLIEMERNCDGILRNQS